MFPALICQSCYVREARSLNSGRYVGGVEVISYSYRERSGVGGVFGALANVDFYTSVYVKLNLKRLFSWK